MKETDVADEIESWQDAQQGETIERHDNSMSGILRTDRIGRRRSGRTGQGGREMRGSGTYDLVCRERIRVRHAGQASLKKEM